MFEHLNNELSVIQSAWGFSTLEAIEYMLSNYEEAYKGTAVGRELKQFMKDGNEFFQETV